MDMKSRRRFDMIFMIFNQFFPQNICSSQVPNQQRYNVIGLQLVPKTWRFEKFVLGLMSDMKTRLPLSSNGHNEQTNPDLLTKIVAVPGAGSCNYTSIISSRVMTQRGTC